VTQIQGGFLKAWSEGARTWRENSAADKAGFYPLSQAWRLFEPVGLPGEGERLEFPSAEAVQKSYTQEFNRFLRREVDPRVAALQKEIQQSQSSPKAVNKLGVLYARFGLLESAEKEFRRILSKEEYLPALINLGNVLYVKRDLTGALSHFAKASKKAPENPAVLLNLARINHEMENYAQVKQSYEKLAKVSPALAEQNKYLALQGDQAARAGEVQGRKGDMPWQE
jgi:tetratricopeptide (TPR) repeat protein